MKNPVDDSPFWLRLLGVTAIGVALAGGLKLLGFDVVSRTAACFAAGILLARYRVL